MSEPARDTALILLTIAYLGGAVLMLVALTKVLLAWSTSWRPSKDDGGPERRGAPGDPVDIDDLREQAAAAMTAVASHAGAATPAVDVVEVLGAPVHSSAGPVTGDGGLAVTRFRIGRPPTVVFATAALTGLSPVALHSLAATSSRTSSDANAARPRAATCGSPATWCSWWPVPLSAWSRW